MKEGWHKTTVGEILKLEYGKPLDSADRKENGLYPAYGANGEKVRTDKFYHDKPSIIVGRKGSAGELNLTTDRFWPLDVTYFVTFDERSFDLRFLYYLLSTLDLPHLAKGIKPGINRNEVYAQQVGVPALAEQQRIVAALDESFEAIERASANVERNLRSVRELFDSCLMKTLFHREAVWKEMSLEEACSIFVDSAHRTPKYQSQGIPALRPRDITNGKLDLAAAACVSKHEYEIQTKRHVPRGGDIVYSRELSYGWAALLPEKPVVCLSQGMCLFRANENVSTEYLLLMLNSRILRAQAEGNAVGTAHPHINLGDIKAFRIPLPPLAKQHAIAETMMHLRSECDHLITLVERRGDRLTELRHSLLGRAFTAEL